MIYLPAMVSVTSHFDKHRSRATGIAATGPSLGNFAIALVLAFLLKTYAWKRSLIIYGCLVLSCSAFGFIFNSKENDIKKTSEKSCIAKADLNKNANVIEQSSFTELFSLMKDSSFCIFAISNFLVRWVKFNICQNIFHEFKTNNRHLWLKKIIIQSYNFSFHNVHLSILRRLGRDRLSKLVLADILIVLNDLKVQNLHLFNFLNICEKNKYFLLF